MTVTLLVQWAADANPPVDTVAAPPLPKAQSPHSAGLDLIAWLPEPLLLRPLQRARVPTGISIALPPGYEGQVRPRSGLAANHGITVLNAPGTIDADYRGQVAVLLINLSDRPFTIRKGDRIAQLVVAPVAYPVALEVVAKLPESSRGSGGFGSTGMSQDPLTTTHTA